MLLSNQSLIDLVIIDTEFNLKPPYIRTDALQTKLNGQVDQTAKTNICCYLVVGKFAQIEGSGSQTPSPLPYYNFFALV
jgi:hypothetical protein